MANQVFGPRIPGSPAPFNPINAFGKTPTVTRRDGSVIEWKSPLREPLFQVFVEDAGKGRIPISPKIGMAVADSMAAACNLAIKTGKISGWSNPHVERCAERPGVIV